MKCPYCVSQRPRLHVSKPAAEIYRCPECGGGFVHPQMSDEALSKLYTENYYRSWGLENKGSATKAMKIATFNRYLSVLRRYKSGGKILDVGCATGFFLSAAAAQGFDAYGVELAGYAAEAAGKIAGRNKVYNGRLEDCPFPEREFEAITMFDLLEHVRAPLLTLAAARRLLKDDGIVLVMTPDIDSLSARVMGGTWTHYKAEHLYYFNERAMALTARGSGFELAYAAKAEKTISLEYALGQFAAYPHRLISPLLRCAARLLPARLGKIPFSLHMGESLYILKKSG